MKRFRILKNTWLLFLLILFVGCLAGCSQGQEKPVGSVSEAVKQEEISASKNVLLNTYGDIVPGSELDRAEIGSITFLSTTADAPDTAWEAGDGTGSVLAWTEPGDNGLLDLYFAGEGGVWAPEDSWGLFDGYTNAKAIYFDSNFFTAGVKEMSSMFADCYMLEELDLSSFDTSSVEAMNSMFSCFTYVNQTDAAGNIFRSIEPAQSKLCVLDISSFDTSNVRNMGFMFASDWQISELDLSHFDFRSVASADSMFWNNELETLHLPKVLEGIAHENLGLSSNVRLQYASNYPDDYNPNALGPFLSRLFAKNVLMPVSEPAIGTSETFVTVPRSDILREDVISVEFLDSLKRMPEDAWDVSRDQDGSVMAWAVKLDNGFYQLYIAGEGGVWAPEVLSHWFENYSNLVMIDFNNAFHTSTASHMECMFLDCMSLPRLDLSSFDTSNVGAMSMMFHGCQRLWDLDVSSFDTSNVYIMQRMFAFGHTVKQLPSNPNRMAESWMEELDLRNFDFEFSLTMNNQSDEMFYGDLMLEKVYVSEELPNREVWDHFECVMAEKTPTGPKATEKRPSAPNTLFSKPGFVLSTTGSLAKENLGLIEDSLGNTSAFGTPICRNSVTQITFLSDLSAAPADAWDVSEGYDGTVLAWATGKGGKYSMTIASDGGVYAPADSTTLFGGFQNLTAINWNDAFHTDNVENMEGMFYACKKLKKLDLSFFDTTDVTDMSHMFKHCYALEKLEIGSFDTSNVRDMSEMFAMGAHAHFEVMDDGTKVLRDDSYSNLKTLDVSHFNTAAVENMEAMFNWCTALEELDVGNFITANVSNMAQMFSNCLKIKELDISGFDTSNVLDMHSMFNTCPEIETLDVSGFDTSKVTDMGWMFNLCESLKKLDVSHFDTANVECMDGMFNACSRLTQLDVGGFDTSNVQNFSNMFSLCIRLRKLDVSGFDTANAVGLNQMFACCFCLEVPDVSGFRTPGVNNMDSMFAYCSVACLQDAGEMDEKTYENRFAEALNAVYGTSDLNQLSQRIQQMDMTNKQTVFETYFEKSTLDFSGMDTGNVLFINDIFAYCHGYETIKLGRFDLNTAQENTVDNPYGYTGASVYGSMFTGCCADVTVVEADPFSAEVLSQQDGIATINGLSVQEWLRSI